MNAAFSEQAHAGEIFEALFQPDVTAPADYLDRLKRSAPLEPEKLLLIAVLEDAIESFQDYVSSTRDKDKQQHADAREWIFGDDREWIFSFLNICDLLDLDPAYVRKGLLLWEKTQLEAHNPAHGSQENQKHKKGADLYGRKTENLNDRRRHSGGRQPKLAHRRQARAAARLGLAAVRKTRAL